MSQSPIQAAIQQICQEKNLDEAVVLRAIEAALAAAYRKDFGNKLQNIITEFDPKTGEVKAFDIKTVVEDEPEEGAEEELSEAEETEAKEAKTEKKKKTKEEAGASFAAAFAAALKEKQEREEQETAAPEKEQQEKTAMKSFLAEEVELTAEEQEKRFNPKTEIQIKDALIEKPDAKIGDEIVTPLEVPGEFGRMAAQTAKQVIIQKLREEERLKIFEEFKSLEHTIVTGTIQRREGQNVFVDLGHTAAIMPPEEQVERERYNIGNRLKFYLKTVDQGLRGSMMIVSRADVAVVKGIFEEEIPEIATGAVEIKSLAREAGSRTKVAIASTEENIDPIGACVGQRGSRIQTIISELSGEKVDIILYDADPAKFITNSLSPAKVNDVIVDGASRIAKVKVREDQLSLAIGRGGQNVRLASKLTGWKIDIISDGGEKYNPEKAAETAESATTGEATAETPKAGTIVATEEKTATEAPAEKKKKTRKNKAAEDEAEPAEIKPEETPLLEETPITEELTEARPAEEISEETSTAEESSAE
ncbi:MAG: transcription termination factor NusA [Patescibacteria group bacterium]|jgi:N utilization substance protein A